MSEATPFTFNSPEAVMRVMTDLNKVIDKHDEFARNRMLPRREIVLPILIQLMNENKLPCSDSLEGVSLDVSFSGIGFLCPKSIPGAKYALIQFAESMGEHMPLMVEIKNQQQLGPFVKIGGPFDVNWKDSDFDLDANDHS